MRKKILVLSIVLNIILAAILVMNLIETKYSKLVADHFDFDRYRIENTRLMGSNGFVRDKVVFIGNSITANWINLNPFFFGDNQFINRGVGGQTSTQILLRFRQDVVDIGTKTVVLNTGINDIGEGDGFYRKEFTVGNIKSIIDICKANDIELILTSVLPATEIKKNRFCTLDNVQLKIEELNKEIKDLANKHQLKLIDYNSKLRNDNGTFNESYTFDGLHPNKEGYQIMETLVLDMLNMDNN